MPLPYRTVPYRTVPYRNKQYIINSFTWSPNRFWWTLFMNSLPKFINNVHETAFWCNSVNIVHEPFTKFMNNVNETFFRRFLRNLPLHPLPYRFCALFLTRIFHLRCLLFGFSHLCIFALRPSVLCPAALFPPLLMLMLLLSPLLLSLLLFMLMLLVVAYRLGPLYIFSLSHSIPLSPYNHNLLLVVY